MDKIILLNLVVNLIGIPSVVVAFIYIGRKLQIVDDLKEFFHTMDDRFHDLLRRVSYMEGKQNNPVRPTKDSR